MTNLQHVALLMSLIFLPMVNSLECYKCGSTDSLNDCDAKRTRAICHSNATHCATLSGYVSSSETGYVKGCTSTCQISEICGERDLNCNMIQCCTSDYCNGALQGISRECYHCVSTHSFKDCDAKRKRVTCSTSQNCVKASVNARSGVKHELYIKGCANTCSPSAISVCRDPNYKCEVSCCSSQYCNGASGSLVNGILLIVTVTASFMYLFG